MKREKGYYWVRLQGIWIIARYTSNEEWFITGREELYFDSDFEVIDENEIFKRH